MRRYILPHRPVSRAPYYILVLRSVIWPVRVAREEPNDTALAILKAPAADSGPLVVHSLRMEQRGRILRLYHNCELLVKVNKKFSDTFRNRMVLIETVHP